MYKILKSLPFAIAFGLTLGFGTDFLIDKSSDTYYAERNIKDVFSTHVTVSDFLVGQDPDVIYEKHIKEDFVGDFTVEIRSLDDDLSRCIYGDVSISYDVEKDGSVLVRPLSWYLGYPKPGEKEYCFQNLEPGQYYLVTTYTLRQKDRPVRTPVFISNIFKIHKEQGKGIQ